MEESADAAAAGRVGLEDIDCTGLEHAAEVPDVESVFSGGDVHSRWRAVAQEPEAFQIVRGNRLLEPAHTVFAKHRREIEGLLPRVRAVGVHEQLGIGPDRVARSGNTRDVHRRIATHLHLYAADSLGYPCAE